MRIAVSGSRRDMGQKAIGDFPLDGPTFTDDGTGRFKLVRSGAYFREYRGNVTIGWQKSLRLSGDYDVKASFSKDDINVLFKRTYGNCITNEMIEECNLTISDEVLQKYLGEMTVDKLFNLFWSREHKLSRLESSDPESPLNKKLSKRVSELELSNRSMNSLKNDNVLYIGQLVQKSASELIRTPNMGRKSVNEINEVLAEMGLRLGTEVTGWQVPGLDHEPEEDELEKLMRKELAELQNSTES